MQSMGKLIAYIAAAAAGLWLATIFVPGVKVELLPDSNFFGFILTARWQVFLLLGIILGLLNYFVKPLLEAIALPLKIITLGFFSLIISAALIWIVDLIFEELFVPLWLPLLYTALIIWILSFILSKILDRQHQ